MNKSFFFLFALILIEFLKESLEKNKPYDPKAFYLAVREIDFNWAHTNELYPTKPTGDVIEVATRTEKEYAHFFK